MGPTPTPTLRLTREDPRAEVGEDVRVGPMEFQLYYCRPSTFEHL